MGRTLGHGGFCVVFEVRLKNQSKFNTTSITSSCVDSSNGSSGTSALSKKEEEHISEDDHEKHPLFHFLSSLRKQNKLSKHHNHSDKKQFSLNHHDRFIQRHHHGRDSIEYPYALKRIQPKLYNDIIESDTSDFDIHDYSTLVSAISDLALEAKYLSIFHHPHIIKIRAISNHSPYDYHHLFIVLDKLNCMLSHQLNYWKQQKTYHHPNSFTHLLLDHHGYKEQACFYIRLKYAYDIATAIDYLHDNK
jgi:hypothetical protein